jgi:Arc/MetJ family transcription regulator
LLEPFRIAKALRACAARSGGVTTARAAVMAAMREFAALHAIFNIEIMGRMNRDG